MDWKLIVLILLAVIVAGLVIQRLWELSHKPKKPLDLQQEIAKAPKLQLQGIYYAGPVICVMISAFAYAIVWGKDWDKKYQDIQLHGLVFSLWGLVGILSLVVVALSAGLINSLNLSVGALKASVNLDDSKDDPPSSTSSSAQDKDPAA